MPVVINGSSGINTPGLESAAMPTVGGDAVVESGSNSDGRWLRYSSGEQFCFSREYVIGGDIAQASAYGGYAGFVRGVQFPAPFASAPLDVNVTVLDAPLSAGFLRDLATATEFDVVVRATSSINSGDFGYGYTAYGQWK